MFSRPSAASVPAIVFATALVAGAFATLCPSTVYGGTIAITNQTFDSLGSAANAALPDGWRVSKSAVGTSAIHSPQQYVSATTATERADGVDVSSTAANGIYNFGSGDSDTGGDRAVGFLATGTAGGLRGGNLYYAFDNTADSDIVSLDLSYDVEKYRRGSNSAGWAIQLFYSTDGVNWNIAGNAFRTAFSADPDNTGYATAPGVTTHVATTTLNLANPVAPGSTLYVAWNYSPASNLITTSAQALALDNIVISANTTDPIPAVPTPAAFPAALALLCPLLARRCR